MKMFHVKQWREKMSKYTMTLEEMVDLGIPIFNEDIETIVTG